MLKRKALANMSIFKLVLAATAAFIIITVVAQGNLGEAIRTGFDMSKKSTDYTIDVEEDEDISQAAMYVYHRASKAGCKKEGNGNEPTVWHQNNGQLSHAGPNRGYPALTDTYLGRNPPCVGGSDSIIRGFGDAAAGSVQELGYDMEGIYSRVKFEVPNNDEQDSIVLYNYGPDDQKDTWLEHNLLAAAHEGKDERIAPSCGKGFWKNYVESLAYVSIGPAYIGKWVTNNDYSGTGSKFVVFFASEDIDDASGRTNLWMKEKKTLEGRAYCTLQFTGSSKDVPLLSSNVDDKFSSENVRVVLCPGDEGYIQMNKGSPHNDEEASSDVVGDDENFPFIQVTDVEQESCGPGSSADPPEVTVENVWRDSGAVFFNVDVTNNGINDKNFKVVLAPSTSDTGDANEFPVYSWRNINGDPDDNTELIDRANIGLNELGEGSKFGCEVAVIPKEQDVGLWTEQAKNVNISEYVPGCGGGPATDGTLNNVQFSKKQQGDMNPWDSDPYLLKVDLEIENLGDYDGDFRTFYYEGGTEVSKIPRGAVLPGGNWKSIDNGNTASISNTAGKLSKYDCDVRIVLKEAETRRNVEVYENTYSIPGSVKSGC